MSVTKVSVKWGKNKYDDVEVNTAEPPELLKAQIYALSGVPPDRQKLMVKGKTIQDQSWGDIKLSDGTAIMMMGSAEAIPTAPVATQASSSKKEQMDEDDDQPLLGLANLGNTCYLNATLQCFRAIPELRAALKKFDGNFVGWENDQAKAQSLTASMKNLFAEIDRYPEKVIPVVMVETLRKIYPRFAERGEHGSFVQQDANEVWVEILQTMRTQLPTISPVSGSAPTMNQSNVNSSFSNAIEQYMSGEFTVTMKCKEADNNEPEVQFKEKFLQLSCFIGNDTKYLQTGLISRMKETITKRATTLGRDAEFDKTMKISRLPAYLTIQLVRFFFKEQKAVGVKILKDVKFQLNLDLYDLCSEELQKKLTPNRLKFKEAEEVEIDRKVQRSKNLDSGLTDAEESPIGYAPCWLEDDVGSSNSGYYELQAVLTHQGRTSNSGHYVAWVRRSEDVWIKYDDDKVSAVNAEEILKLSGGGDWHCAYLLLYGPRRLPIYPAKPAIVGGMALD